MGKRGPPLTLTTKTTLRLSAEMLVAIDQWRGLQTCRSGAKAWRGDKITRADAIRALIQKSLNTKVIQAD